MSSTAIHPTAAPQDRPSDTARDQRVSAREWFASGARRPYDPVAKTMLETGGVEGSSRPLDVFEKVVATPPLGADTRWLTMLPGYPDGSYGYAQVDRCLGPRPGPRLYVEYLGQGDSDKPARYRYSSIERADPTSSIRRGPPSTDSRSSSGGPCARSQIATRRGSRPRRSPSSERR